MTTYHDAMGTEAFADAPRRPVGALDFTVVPLDQAIEIVMNLGASPVSRGVAIHFANAYNVALAENDAEYRSLLNSGDAVFSDGMPVVWAGKRLHPILALSWTRVYGPDVMTGVLDASTQFGPRHYLLGGTPETLVALESNLRARWPQAVIAGAESPPFGAWSATDLAERDERIRQSAATLVWVGLGTPKQDWEVNRIADALPVTALAVGAAFDFLAGTREQAPVWMQRSGLEWSYRLAREPRRLAKRYLWGNPMFVASTIKHRKVTR